jgi:NAD-dependent deacetylase
LLYYIRTNVAVYLIDPNDVAVNRKNVHVIKKGASEGVKELIKLLQIQ